MTATATVVALAPASARRAYVVHRRDVTETATVRVEATSISDAIVQSGLGAGWVHDGKTTRCESCTRALTTGAKP